MRGAELRVSGVGEVRECIATLSKVNETREDGGIRSIGMTVKKWKSPPDEIVSRRRIIG